jgi:chromate reductase
MALDLVCDLAPENVRLTQHELQTLPFYNADLEVLDIPAPAVELAGQLMASDGIVIATPEYNHAMPALLKNAIDWMSRGPIWPLANKPVMIISATTGMLGGARVQYELRRVLDAVGAIPLVKPEVFIGAAQTKFDSTGQCTDQVTKRMVNAQLLCFIEFIERQSRAVSHGTSQNRPEPAAHL